MSIIQYIELSNTLDNTPKTLCLNMIVKNESKNMVRLLDSVSKYIDCFCICDTGSTDNTVETIINYTNKNNIQGKIISEPFVNFEHNRTLAIKACETINSKYILLLDADMKLYVEQSLTKDMLYNIFNNFSNHNCFYLFQCTTSLIYKNVRVVKNNIGARYVGVTHEYLEVPFRNPHTFDKNIIHIDDIGDGGCKSDKYERDIKLLTNGLEKEPTNARYMFYLANSYKNCGQDNNAIEAYKKRIKIGGWIEEIWSSCYSIGLCYQNLNDMANAVFWWMEAYECYPERIENLYKIVNYYRTVNKNKLAYQFYKIAREIQKKYTTYPDGLFLQKDIYDFYMDQELTIIAYYVKDNVFNIHESFLRIFNNIDVPKNIIKQTMNNLKFYTKKLSELGKYITFDRNNITSSCLYNNKILSYIDGKMMTINNGTIEDEYLLYIDIDKVNLFSHNDILHFYGSKNDKFIVGKINLETKSIYDCLTCENYYDDNMSFFVDPIDNKCKFIKKWKPFVEIDIATNESNIITNSLPIFYEYICSSSRGININDEMWFITVNNFDSKYYCSFVLLDELKKFKKCSQYLQLDDGINRINNFSYYNGKFIVEYNNKILVMDKQIVDGIII